MKLKTGLLLNVSLRIRPLTFINEALHLSGSPVVAIIYTRYGYIAIIYASTASPYSFLAGILDVLCQYGHVHPFYRQQVSYKVIKSRRSRETCLTNRIRPISRHRLLMPSGRTDKHIHISTHKPISSARPV